MPIKQVKNLVNSEVKNLIKYQSGEIRPVATGRDHIDDTLSGLLPGDIVVVAGASGSGKTFELQTMRENIMNIDLNPSAENYVFLDYSFEMKLFNLILRGLNKELGKSKKDILLQKFDDTEKPLAKRYMDTLRDPRFWIEENVCTPEKFLEASKEFLNMHKDKERVFIAIDHMALFKNSEGGKKDTIDAAGEAINQLKREYKNAIFILLSQLNRQILGRIADNDNNSAPNRSDLYQSDTMFHLADYLIVIQNAHRLGINQYMKIDPSRFEHLQEHFTEPTGRSGKVSFLTLGRMFYHVLKIREGDVVFNDIYIEIIDSENVRALQTEPIEVMEDDELLRITFDDDEEDPEF